jgi:hypothetical protein
MPGHQPEMPENTLLTKQDRTGVGKARKPVKMFRADLYARVSTHHQQYRTVSRGSLKAKYDGMC